MGRHDVLPRPRPAARAGDRAALPTSDGGAGVTARLRLAELRDLGAAVSRCRRMLDLDADPAAVDDVLGADPALAPLVAAAPGRRVPASPDADELAIRAVLGQQVSVAGARTLTARLLTAGIPWPSRWAPSPTPSLAPLRSPAPT
ncbi:AlkA N-terminal domain-containing protein [Blastococcus brunescens]|uniref:AlkA N-terminal domain-containing protein n=1 Tax=Blastococcus brunescens TaxID=1564165 RepID=A0ABZ1B4R3_9ACTN|nr:AlkA N-terminal domain-containing protein [Blastococcus sp. BMG 8361]WRL64833.1 AlkA N-terminal domain-containing protein [Blastococcus sp. BMG 8361]